MKKKALKILIPIVCILLVMALLVVVFITCARGVFSDKEIMEDGYFQYVILGENSRVPNERNKEIIAIVGFTALGKDQEVIDFPREIDGKPVHDIGYNDEFRNNQYEVYSKNLKKIFIHDNIKYMEYFEGAGVSIMVCSKNDSLVSFPYNSLVFVYKEIYEKLRLEHEMKLQQNPDKGYVRFEETYYRAANISFFNNYAYALNCGYYRLDNIEAGEKISEPPTPERNGYEFVGWFTESECINAWDFDVSPTIEENTEFRLYAGWREK